MANSSDILKVVKVAALMVDGWDIFETDSTVAD